MVEAQHNPTMQSLITSNPYIFIKKGGIKSDFGHIKEEVIYYYQ